MADASLVEVTYLRSRVELHLLRMAAARPYCLIEVSKKRQHYNDVKKKLRAKGLDYRFNFPSWLQVSFNGTSYTFDNPGEVEAFLDKPSV
ncbi:hypothetical protein QQF64_018796 [Cirrhinus molitorella]|uniref:Uncharacterized protein n=1 Tax=Cirrhinus molitorella TaxID=172907 RepID=A0ABR3LDQ6_9TELE